MSDNQNPTKTAVLFEFYVRRIWPFHRNFVRSKYSVRCKTCGASEKMLPLNSETKCSDCEAYSKRPTNSQSFRRQPQEKQRLGQILSSYQKKGIGNYDVLIMFSGGKDSCFLVQKIKNDFSGLRILACTLDNGFMSPVAQSNIAVALAKLNVDHVFIRPKIEFYLKLFRYALTHLNSEGSYGTVDFSDGEFMLDSARNLALEKRIPLILCGYSRYQVQNGLNLQDFESPASRESSNRTQVAGLPLKDIFNSDEIKTWWHGENVLEDQRPRLIFPLYAWDLEEEEIKRQVIEWGLMQKKTQSPIVTNHQLIPLLGVVDVHKFGYSSFEKEFCRMIREGKAEREQWQHTFEFLEYTSKTGLFVRPVVESLLKRLNLTTNDVGIKFT
jgi:tRNA(Ile)-lysidine synthase TilS/MesJ